MKREVRQRPKPKYKHLSHEFTIYLAPRRLERITKGTKPVNVCTIGDLEDHCPTWDKYDILKGRSQETSKTTPNLMHPLSLPQPRADGLGSWCHRYNGGPSSSGHGRRLGLAPPRRAAPRSQPAASGRSGWPRYATGHNARADPAREPRCAESRECH